MSYERQRETALRMVTKYGVSATLHSTAITTEDATPWKQGNKLNTITPIKLVAFADDGVTFVNHNIQGDVRLLTVVSNHVLDIKVGDTIKTAVNDFTVKLAKPLDPDLSGAILWAVLGQ